jgi:hypothetical protein
MKRKATSVEQARIKLEGEELGLEQLRPKLNEIMKEHSRVK